jgi:hypothetical protein
VGFDVGIYGFEIWDRVEVEDVGSADARNRGDGGLGALGEEEVGVGKGEFFVAVWGGRIFVVTSFLFAVDADGFGVEADVDVVASFEGCRCLEDE